MNVVLNQKCKVKKEHIYRFLNSLSAVRDVARVKYTTKGLESRLIDPAHISLVSVKLDKNAFEEYNVEIGEYGFNVDKLLSAISSFDFKDVIEMGMSTVDGDKNIVIHGECGASSSAYELYYRRDLLPVDTMSQPSNITLSHGVRLKTCIDGFKHLIKNCEKKEAEHLWIKYDSTSLSAEVVYGDDSKMDQIVIDKDNFEVVSSDLDEGDSLDGIVKCRYSIDYLSNILKTIYMGTEVTLFLKEDYPLRMEYNLGEYIDAEYVLAPKVK